MAILVLEYILRWVRNVIRHFSHTADEPGLVILRGATRLFIHDDTIKTAAHINTFNRFAQVPSEIDNSYPKSR